MRLIFLIFFTAHALFSFAQNMPTAVVVRDFLIEGNRKTKPKILTRELTFGVGDSIPLSKLATTLEENRLRLMNTNLFNVVKMNVKNWKSGTTAFDTISIAIEVVERWYFYPVPIFELADRNLNVWWNEHRRDMSRTNYGLRLIHGNVRGRRDPLSFLIQFGYTQKFSLAYSMPYINKAQTLGLSGSFSYATNHEIGFATINDTLKFIKDPKDIISKRLNFNIGLTYAKGLYTLHHWSIGSSKQDLGAFITDSLNRLNRDYFIDNSAKQQYNWLSYHFSHDTRDIRPYPKRGHLAHIDLLKSGILISDDVNSFEMSARWIQFIPLSKKLIFEYLLKAKTNFVRTEQPYNFQRALGYGADLVRGYESYVVDAYDFFLSRNSLHFELFDKDLDLTPIFQPKILESWRSLPLKMYLSANFDFAYSNHPFASPANRLNNRWLYGGGIGLDILAYYSMVWRLEYSVNHLGQRGFYVRYGSGF
jgi:outer membrane protein assembly factor BamA